MSDKIVTINNEQRDNYENIDSKNSSILLKRYMNLLNICKLNHSVSILDVGGGQRVFYKRNL